MSEKTITVRYSLDEARKQARCGAFQTRSDTPESEDLGKDFWDTAKVVIPRGKTSVHLRLDSDIVEWFKAHGKGHLTRMNAVLRAYVEARRG